MRDTVALKQFSVLLKLIQDVWRVGVASEGLVRPCHVACYPARVPRVDIVLIHWFARQQLLVDRQRLLRVVAIE